MSEVKPQDHYQVLGVKHDATDLEIKRAYRKLAKELHPDTLDYDATEEDHKRATAAFRQVRLAYEQLSNPDLRAEYDAKLREPADVGFDDSFYASYEPSPDLELPTNGWYEVHGAQCFITFSIVHGWFMPHLQANLRVDVKNLFRMKHASWGLPGEARLGTIKVVDEHGNELANGYWLEGLQHQVTVLLASERRTEDRKRWSAQLALFTMQIDELRQQTKPVEYLQRLLLVARRRVAAAVKSMDATSRDSVMQAIREVEKEITRVAGNDSVETMLEDLLHEHVTHPDHEYNLRLLHDMHVTAARSGGDYEVPTDQAVLAHYRRCLQGLLPSQLYRANLKLPDDREVFMEFVRAGEAKWAPDKVALQGVKRPAQYPVSYGLAKQDGQLVPVGIIELSQGTYERNRGSHGKASSFPELPYGITLLIRVRVEFQDKQLLSKPAPDGKPLENEVNRCQAQLRNPQGREEVVDTLTMLREALIW